MDNYKKLNNLIGWGVWLIATAVYFLTIEPTASWWDCSERIAAAYKLQIMHPPGAPLYQMLGRLFSLLAAGDVTRVAVMINSMSALSSSFTVLFLFWSITMLARKAALIKGEMTNGKVLAIFGSGIVGALAFTFSDSVWFVAVEAEVYAMSGLFTALVFWAILRWEAEDGQPHSARWLLLIAYLIGLSIGVHMLNLLAIPAIVFVYYFKKFEPSPKGMLIAGVVSVLLLGFIMSVVIPEIVNLFAHTEVMIVNTFGLPFTSGTITFALLLIAFIVFSVKATATNNPTIIRIALGLSVVMFLLILTESRSFGDAVVRIVIAGAIAALIYTYRHRRAHLNTAVLGLAFLLIGYTSFLMIVIRANANPPVNENNPNNAISLLSYLGREQYGTWPLVHGPYYNAPIVDWDDGNPVYTRNNETGRYVVADDREGTVPIYHPAFTTIFPRMWSNQRPVHIREYQRWGRVRGVPVEFINDRGEAEVKQRPTFAENLRYFFRYQIGHMYWRYFLWNYSGRQNDIQGHGDIEFGNWITGFDNIDSKRLGNQHNLPHTKENWANNKFYMLPLLLGLVGLFFHFNRDYKNGIVVSLLFIMTGIAIIVYLNQTPYQPRERDYSYAGSTYAFAIWIGLGVMGIYSLLSRVINGSLAAILATGLTLVMVPLNMAKEGWNSHDRSGKYATLDFAINYLESCEPNAIIFTNGDNDTFPLWYAQEVEGIRTDIRVVNYMLASGEWYIHQKKRMTYDSPPLPFTLTREDYDKGNNNIIPVFERVSGRWELQEIIDFIADPSQRTKIRLQNDRWMNFLPTRDLKITIDREDLLARGIVKEEFAGRIPDEISWQVKKSALYKNDLMMLDFIAANNWERPIYFTSPSAVEDVLDVARYCHLEGIAYRFMPVEAPHYIEGLGGINVDRAFDLLVNRATWGRLHEPDVYLDTESRRTAVMPRQNYFRLAGALVELNRMDSAVMALDTVQKYFPNSKMPYDMFTVSMVEYYYEAGATEKGNQALETIAGNFTADLEYYATLKQHFQDYYERDIQRAFTILHHLSMLSRTYGQTELSDSIDDNMTNLMRPFM